MSGLIAASLLIAALNARADDDVTPPIPATTWTPVVLEHEGQAGLWFPQAQAEQLLWEVSFHLPQLKLAILEQTELGETYERQIATLNQVILLEHQIGESHAEVAKMWRTNYLEQSDRDNSLFSNPTFWLAIGVLGGAAATIGIASAIHEVTN